MVPTDPIIEKEKNIEKIWQNKKPKDKEELKKELKNKNLTKENIYEIFYNSSLTSTE